MTPLKQGLLSAVVLGLAAGGWYAFQHRDQVFGSSQPAVPPMSGGAADKGARPGGTAIVVVPGRVTMDATGDQLNALGTAAALQATTLYPQSSGLITEINIHAGDHVDKDAVLVRLDDQNEKMALAKAQIALTDAAKARDRASQLAKSETGTEVDLANAESTLEKAKVDLQVAQLALDRRTITAPFAGVVGLTARSVGDLVTPSTPMATLDDLSALIVIFDAPQRFATLMKVGSAVSATAEGLPGITMRGSVSAVDSRLDETVRTFKVRATLVKGIDGLKPGMATAVSIAFAENSQATVSSAAVQWDRHGSYVWKLDGNVARRTAVQILGRRSGTVIVAGDLAEGEEVAVEGLQRLSDGISIVRAAVNGSLDPGGGAPQIRPTGALGTGLGRLPLPTG